jgi:hypothetical protein
VSARKYETEGDWSERVAARAIRRMAMTSRPGTSDGPERAARFLAALEVARSKTPAPLPAVAVAPPSLPPVATEPDETEPDAADIEAGRQRVRGLLARRAHTTES